MAACCPRRRPIVFFFNHHPCQCIPPFHSLSHSLIYCVVVLMVRGPFSSSPLYVIIMWQLLFLFYSANATQDYTHH